MSFFTDLIELLLPERCAGCGAAPVLLCAACALPLRGPARPARTTPPGLPPPWTVAAYEGPLRTILAAYKEHGRTALAVPLGEALAASIQVALTASRPGSAVRHLAGARTTRAPDHAPLPALPDRDVVLVWVPSGRGAIRRRGHDALRGTVNVALRRLRANGLRLTAVPALRQVGHVADQAGLTAAQRTANLNGALEVPPRVDLTGREIVLVDDVITTGASLTEAARALRAAGAHVTAAATIAATPRHHPR